MRSLAGKKIINTCNWHLFITQMETKWTKWYTMTSHVIAYRSLELHFDMHTFNFNCFFDDFNCVFTQTPCLSRLLGKAIFFDDFNCVFTQTRCLFRQLGKGITLVFIFYKILKYLKYRILDLLGKEF